MDADRLELLRGLFAAVTVVLEDAHETAIRGQNAHLGPASLLKAAEKLSTAARDLLTLTEAVTVLARRTSRHNKPTRGTPAIARDARHPGRHKGHAPGL